METYQKQLQEQQKLQEKVKQLLQIQYELQQTTEILIDETHKTKRLIDLEIGRLGLENLQLRNALKNQTAIVTYKIKTE